MKFTILAKGGLETRFFGGTFIRQRGIRKREAVWFPRLKLHRLYQCVFTSSLEQLVSHLEIDLEAQNLCT